MDRESSLGSTPLLIYIYTKRPHTLILLTAVSLGRIIRSTSAPAASFGTTLLLADYLLLAIANLCFDASLCFHPHHKAMVDARGQAARARRLWAAAVSISALLLLGLLEFFVEGFTHEYVRGHACWMSGVGDDSVVQLEVQVQLAVTPSTHGQQILLAPLVLIGEEMYDVWQGRLYRRHIGKDTDSGCAVAPHQLRAAEAADLSQHSSSNNSGSDGKNCARDVEEGGGMPSTVSVTVVGGTGTRHVAFMPGDPTLAIGSVESALPNLLAPPPALQVSSTDMPPPFSFISPIGLRPHLTPQHTVVPPPRRIKDQSLPIWYRLKIRRIAEVQDLFANVVVRVLKAMVDGHLLKRVLSHHRPLFIRASIHRLYRGPL